jgi:hypothetical protein
MGLLCLLPGCEWLNQNLGWGPGRPGVVRPEQPETGWWEERDTGGFDGSWEPVVNSVNAVCEDVEGTADFHVHVTFAGWMELVTVDMVASTDDDRVETFVLPAEDNISFCQDQSCDEWRTVFTQSEIHIPNAGAMTLDCTDLATTDDGLFTSAAFRITGTPDNTRWGGQCAIWGHRSREIFGDECDCFDAFLGRPPEDPCGDHTAAR